MTGDEAVAALPATIRVAGYDMKIARMSIHEAVGRNVVGEFSGAEQRISLNTTISSPERVVDAFLHEAAHAIWWAYGISDDDKEERVVSTLGTAMMTLHRDNPWLANWISTALA